MNRDELTTWFRRKLGERIAVPPERIDLDRPLETIGLDSMEAVELTAEIEAELGRPVDPTSLWDYPTATALIAALCDDAAPGAELSDAEVDAELARMLAREDDA